MATTTVPKTYITNPIEMLKPSSKALGISAVTLLKLLVLQLAPILILALGVVGIIASMAADALLGTIICATIIGVGAVGGLALGLLTAPAYTLIILAAVDGNKLGVRESLKNATPYIWRMLGLAILLILAVVGGLILFIIPGLIFMAWFSLASYILVSENLGIIDSMKRSKELVRGRVWEMWGLMSLASAASIIPYIGQTINFVLTVVLLPGHVIRYRQLVATKPESRPDVHWANYALIALGIIGSLFVSSLSTYNY